MPSVFPLWRVLLTASIAAVLGLALLRWRFKSMRLREVVLMTVLVSLSIMAWRLSGNVSVLNDDPIGGLSPNDFICPLVSYVFLSLYLDVRQPEPASTWIQARASLVVIVFVVNVFTI